MYKMFWGDAIRVTRESRAAPFTPLNNDIYYRNPDSILTISYSNSVRSEKLPFRTEVTLAGHVYFLESDSFGKIEFY